MVYPHETDTDLSVTGSTLTGFINNFTTNPSDPNTNNLNNTIRGLQRQFDASEVMLRKSKTLINVLRQDKSRMKDEIIALTNQVQSLSAELDNIKQSAVDIGTHAGYMQRDVNNANNERDVALLQLKEGNKKSRISDEHHEEQMNESNQRNLTLTHNLNEMMKEKALLTNERNDANYKLQQVQQQSHPTAQQINTLKHDKLELSGNLASVESSLRTSQSETAKIRQELLIKSETCAVLLSQIESIQSKGTVIPKNDLHRYKMLEIELLKVNVRYEELEKSLDAHNELLAEEVRIKNKMRSDASVMSGERIRDGKRIEELEGVVKAEKGRVGELTTEVALLKRRCDKLKSQSNSSSKKVLAFGRTNATNVNDSFTSNKENQMKNTLSNMASQRLTSSTQYKKEKQNRKSQEQTVSALATKQNYTELQLTEGKVRFAKLKAEKKVVEGELKSQRRQNFVLHRRLGEIFDNSNNSSSGGVSAVRACEITTVEVRTVLERAIFDWNIKSTVNGDSSTSSSSATGKMSSSKAQHVHNRRANDGDDNNMLPQFEAKYFSERSMSTSTNLSAMKPEPFWDVVLSESTNRNSANKELAEDIMQRYQLKQFMANAQRQRDVDRAWFAFAEKTAYAMTMSLAIEMEAARMCSSVRVECGGLAARMNVVVEEFKIAVERGEVERKSKHKTVLKYVQEVLNNAMRSRSSNVYENDEYGGSQMGESVEGGSDDEGNGKRRGGISIKLPETSLDDETLHGVCSLLVPMDRGCVDWIQSHSLPPQLSTTVEHLLVRDNNLSDVSAATLHDLISKSLALQSIDMRGNGLTTSGIESLKSSAESNKYIERVEIRSSSHTGCMLICHREGSDTLGAIGMHLQPLIIDCRDNDPRRIEGMPYLTTESVELLLGNVAKMKMNVNMKLPSAAATTTNINSKPSSTSSSFKKRVGSNSKKKSGYFGSENIDFALSAPPGHMPMLDHTFMTGIDNAGNSGNGNNRTARFGGTLSGGGGGGATRSRNVRSRSRSASRENILNSDSEDGTASLQASAAAASDAPPGERELGNLLDKKIRLMERRVASKSRLSLPRSRSASAGGNKNANSQSGNGNGNDRWASSSNGLGLGKRAGGGGGSGGMGRSASASSIRPSSSNRHRSGSGGGGGGGGGREEYVFSGGGRQNLNASNVMNKPPTGKGLRPKSAVMRRLPF